MKTTRQVDGLKTEGPAPRIPACPADIHRSGGGSHGSDLRITFFEVLTHAPIDDILSSVRIITTKRLGQYCQKHARARPSLTRWMRVTRAARWMTWADVKASFSSADLVRVASGRNCIVFNIAGNQYRLITAVHHSSGEGQGRVYILTFLTHAEYDTNQWKEHL
ncbi:MAG: type II toxin-antitoxin system HigB family toxin [Verrucomicrobia bacterium]|nr:type II toxin-antitoxin system HigB family toxin [Verrucomicrobiota bacterium]